MAVLALFALLTLSACEPRSSHAPAPSPTPDVWTIYLYSAAGEALGTVVVQTTGRLTDRSCIATNASSTFLGLVAAKLPEAPSMQLPPISDRAAVEIVDSTFWMDLSLDYCDNNACLFGSVAGRYAQGDFLHNTIFGYVSIGTFFAECH